MHTSSALFWRTLPAFTLAAAATLAWLAPTLWGDSFNGCDGTLWLRPFILWIGGVGAAALALLPWWRTRFKGEGFHEVMSLRWSQGEAFYPDAHLKPLVEYHAPFFYMVGSLFYRLFPDSFGYGRLVSTAATLLTAVVLFFLARHRSANATTGLWASVLYLATYGVAGKMYDWALIDPLLGLIIALCALFFVRNTPRGDFWALFFAGLACLTKQPAALAFMVIFSATLLKRRALWVYAPVLFWALAGATLVLATQGRAWRYLVEYPWRIGSNSWWNGRTMQILFVYCLPLWVGVIYNVYKRGAGRFEALAGTVMVGAILGTLHSGGWINSLFAFIPLLCAAAVSDAKPVRAILYVQFILGLYNPFGTLYPYRQMKDFERQALSMARQYRSQGAVWFLGHSYLAPRAGCAMLDDLGSLEGHCAAGFELPLRIMDAITHKRFALIILKKESLFWLASYSQQMQDALKQNYISQTKNELVLMTPSP